MRKILLVYFSVIIFVNCLLSPGCGGITSPSLIAPKINVEILSPYYGTATVKISWAPTEDNVIYRVYRNDIIIAEIYSRSAIASNTNPLFFIDSLGVAAVPPKQISYVVSAVDKNHAEAMSEKIIIFY